MDYYVDKIKVKYCAWIKMGKNTTKIEKVKITNLITNNQQVILASLSKTRHQEIKKYFKNIILTKHYINEKKEKRKYKQLNAKDMAYHLARLKAISISGRYREGFIIGCDQTLECNGKILSKPDTLTKAKKNLKELSGKKHKLYTCIYVLKNLREYFVEETTAELSFKKTTDEEISDYIKNNKATAMSCVGSYKIEENEKYKFIKILKGSKESIIGFPLKKFLRRIKKKK